MGAPAKTTADKSAARREQAAALHESITAKVAQLTDTDAWAAYLTAAAAFHSYSFNNVMLIFSQAPDASQVAGFRKWQELGRQVRKGEKSIKIFGYSTKKITETDTETGEETTRRAARFPILSVFDIAQTDPIEGHPAAAAETITTRLEGEDSAAIYSRVAQVMTEQGWTVTREHIAGESNGRTSLDGSRRIIVDDTISDAQAAKTMIHEAAHALMHASGDIAPAELHRGRAEVEAESVAYVLAGLLGLDTTDYSIGYIAGWGNGDLEVITDTARAVLATVHTLAEALEPDADDAEDTAAA